MGIVEGACLLFSLHLLSVFLPASRMKHIRAPTCIMGAARSKTVLTIRLHHCPSSHCSARHMFTPSQPFASTCFSPRADSCFATTILTLHDVE